MLEMGLIEESRSPYASPIVTVPKPDGSLRTCTNYRSLNKLTVFDARINDIIDNVGQTRYITTLNLTQGYYQIPLAEDTKEKSAFITPLGLYQYNFLPFGMCGAVATFQRLVDMVLRGCKDFAKA